MAREAAAPQGLRANSLKTKGWGNATGASVTKRLMAGDGCGACWLHSMLLFGAAMGFEDARVDGDAPVYAVVADDAQAVNNTGYLTRRR